MPTKSGPRDLVRLADLANRLRDRVNVGLVEGALERGAPVPRRAERHSFGRRLGIGVERVVRRDQTRDVHEDVAGGGFAGERVCGHWSVLP